jgi:hypothetical protein
MIYHLTNRRGFLDFLTDKDLAPASLRNAQAASDIEQALLSSVDPDAVMLVWRDEASLNSPFDTFLIILPDGLYENFLAWTFTYVGGYRPITSFFRIIRASDIERFELFSNLKPWLSRRALDAFAAAAIAEASVQIGARARGRFLTVQNCMLTFSFAATRGLYAGLHPSQLVDLAERWDDFRQINGASVPRLSANEGLSFWLVASSALLPDHPSSNESDWMGILSAIIRRIHGGETDLPSAAMWGPFVEIAQAVAPFAEAGALARERQIRVLDQAAIAIKKSEAPRPLKDAALGMLVAKLGDGSIQYMPLSMDLAEGSLCASLWFAFFSAFHKSSDGLTAANSLGRHVVRRAAIQRDIFDKSKTSLGFDEGRIIAGSKGSEMLLGSFGAVVEIELLPCIAAPMPNPTRRVEDDQRKREPVRDPTTVTRLLREAITILEQGTRPTNRVHEDADLFHSEDAPAKEQETKRAPKRRK